MSLQRNNNNGMVSFPTEPLRDHLRHWLKWHQEYTIKDLAVAAGVSDRRLRGIINGTAPRVSLDSADRLALFTGESLYVLYPPTPEEELEWALGLAS